MPYPCDFLHNCSIEKNAETLRLSLSRSLRLSLSLSLALALPLSLSPALELASSRELLLASLLFSSIFTQMGEKHDIFFTAERARGAGEKMRRRATGVGADPHAHLSPAQARGNSPACWKGRLHAAKEKRRGPPRELPVRFPLFRFNAKTGGRAFPRGGAAAVDDSMG